MLEWLKKLLGNSNEAEVKKLSKIVDQVGRWRTVTSS